MMGTERSAAVAGTLFPLVALAYVGFAAVLWPLDTTVDVANGALDAPTVARAVGATRAEPCLAGVGARLEGRRADTAIVKNNAGRANAVRASIVDGGSTRSSAATGARSGGRPRSPSPRRAAGGSPSGSIASSTGRPALTAYTGSGSASRCRGAALPTLIETTRVTRARCATTTDR